MRKLLLITLAILIAGVALAKDELPKPLVPMVDGVRADEVEPNDDCATANGFVDVMNGEITAEDQDWFEFEATAGATITFETGVQDGQDAMDTTLYLYADRVHLRRRRHRLRGGHGLQRQHHRLLHPDRRRAVAAAGQRHL